MSREWICAACTSLGSTASGASPAWARCWFTRSTMVCSCADIVPDTEGTGIEAEAASGSWPGGLTMGGGAEVEAGDVGVAGFAIGTNTTGAEGLDCAEGPEFGLAPG